MIYQTFAYREKLHCEPKSLDDIFEFIAYTKTEAEVEDLAKTIRSIQ